MKLYNSLNSMKYGIAKYNKNIFEFDGVNCDTCKIYMNNIFYAYYNFNTNILSFDYRQEEIITKNDISKTKYIFIVNSANKYFIALYKEIYYARLKSGDLFSPTSATEEETNYYLKNIARCKENLIKGDLK